MKAYLTYKGFVPVLLETPVFQCLFSSPAWPIQIQQRPSLLSLFANA